jgi:serine/threonine protein kinase
MNAVAPVLPGETLAGKYRIERVIGQGGMGIVVAARHLELDERVAIKFLVGAPSEAAAERFLREARAAAKVKGEHVCRVFDFGKLETGEPYIVMEYLEGTDLARVLSRGGPQAPATVVGWIVEACAALAEAHALGIVHRDLKPANVFLATRPDGSSCAKVLDFGISKLPQSATMTGPTAAMGSPLYMSPEQMESARDVDARADVWSLGVVMYELLTGKPPFVGESMAQLTVLVREKDAPPMEGVPESLAAVVTKCLAKRAADRYVGVAELTAALAPFAPDEVAPLVARLSKRTTPALDVTEPAAPRAKKEPDHLARARGTFEPLQSTMGEAPPARRWPLVLGAIGAVALVAIAAKSIGGHSAPEIAPEAAAAGS